MGNPVEDFAKNTAEPWLALHYKTFWGGIVIGVIVGFILAHVI